MPSHTTQVCSLESWQDGRAFHLGVALAVRRQNERPAALPTFSSTRVHPDEMTNGDGLCGTAHLGVVRSQKLPPPSPLTTICVRSNSITIDGGVTAVSGTFGSSGKTLLAAARWKPLESKPFSLPSSTSFEPGCTRLRKPYQSFW